MGGSGDCRALICASHEVAHTELVVYHEDMDNAYRAIRPSGHLNIHPPHTSPVHTVRQHRSARKNDYIMIIIDPSGLGGTTGSARFARSASGRFRGSLFRPCYALFTQLCRANPPALLYPALTQLLAGCAYSMPFLHMPSHHPYISEAEKLMVVRMNSRGYNVKDINNARVRILNNLSNTSQVSGHRGCHNVQLACWAQEEAGCYGCPGLRMLAHHQYCNSFSHSSS